MLNLGHDCLQLADRIIVLAGKAVWKWRVVFRYIIFQSWLEFMKTQVRIIDHRGDGRKIRFNLHSIRLNGFRDQSLDVMELFFFLAASVVLFFRHWVFFFWLHFKLATWWWNFPKRRGERKESEEYIYQPSTTIKTRTPMQIIPWREKMAVSSRPYIRLEFYAVLVHHSDPSLCLIHEADIFLLSSVVSRISFWHSNRASATHGSSERELQEWLKRAFSLLTLSSWSIFFPIPSQGLLPERKRIAGVFFEEETPSRILSTARIPPVAAQLLPFPFFFRHSPIHLFASSSSFTFTTDSLLYYGKAWRETSFISLVNPHVFSLSLSCSSTFFLILLSDFFLLSISYNIVHFHARRINSRKWVIVNSELTLWTIIECRWFVSDSLAFSIVIALSSFYDYSLVYLDC